MLGFDVDIGLIIATNDDIVMDVNEEPIRVNGSSMLMLHCATFSSLALLSLRSLVSFEYLARVLRCE